MNKLIPYGKHFIDDDDIEAVVEEIISLIKKSKL